MTIPKALTTSTLANQVQFYQKSENFGVAISSTREAGNADFLLQLTAPVSYGWASVGTGDKMDESLMFIIYPSGQGDGKYNMVGKKSFLVLVLIQSP